MQLLMSDTNVLIDMEEGKLLALFFDLPFTFCVPDILYFEELEAQHAHLMDMGLSLKELTAESLLEAQPVMQRHSGPSRNDIFALLLAKQEECPLISGDSDLRTAAKIEQVEVRGTLWLVEEMVHHALIDTEQALTAYEKMEAAGRRLPWAEARKRIRQLGKS